MNRYVVDRPGSPISGIRNHPNRKQISMPLIRCIASLAVIGASTECALLGVIVVCALEYCMSVTRSIVRACMSHQPDRSVWPSPPGTSKDRRNESLKWARMGRVPNPKPNLHGAHHPRAVCVNSWDPSDPLGHSRPLRGPLTVSSRGCGVTALQKIVGFELVPCRVGQEFNNIEKLAWKL
jgi:hypothetical protein